MKNQIIKLEITDITPEGFGVGRHEGKVVFVSDTAVGDEIEALVLKELKSHSFAKISKILKPSKDRIETDCEISQKCGGCVFRHIDYQSEINLKKNFIKQSFLRIGGLDIEVNDTVCGDDKNYRNKVQYPFAPDELGGVKFGYYARRSHRIVEHSACPLQDKIFTDIADFTSKTATNLGITAYDEAKSVGVLRHIVMRKNRKGEISVCLVVTEKNNKLKKLGYIINEEFSQVIGVHLNINKRRDNVIFGEETVLVVGDEVLKDTLCGKKFELSPRSFYQVNADMAEKLYNHGKSLLDTKEGSVILDLYCGVGTIGLSIAGDNDKLCGVEIVDSAIENAKKNALANGRTEENTLFVCGDASVGVAECQKKFGNPQVIIVDPPRKGLDEAVINTIVKASPEKILYISCDHSTLARDCAIFAKSGYVTHKATPFDLFPRTGHVETVVCLER